MKAFICFLAHLPWRHVVNGPPWARQNWRCERCGREWTQKHPGLIDNAWKRWSDYIKKF